MPKRFQLGKSKLTAPEFIKAYLCFSLRKVIKEKAESRRMTDLESKFLSFGNKAYSPGLYQAFNSIDYSYDLVVDFRGSGQDTGIKTRHPSPIFESRDVARMIFGMFVGWTYYHGGSRRLCAEDVDWIDNAYFVEAEKEWDYKYVRFKRM